MGFDLGKLGEMVGNFGGGLTNQTIGKIPGLKDISPAQFDPAVILGITKTSPAGALVENTTNLLPMAGKIVGTAVGSAYGNPQLGGAIGEFAGGVAKGHINTTSDKSGFQDLDGAETIATTTATEPTDRENEIRAMAAMMPSSSDFMDNPDPTQLE